MKSLILTTLILLSVSCRDICNTENSCNESSETQGVQPVSEPEEKTDIVIRDENSLPSCDPENQNMTAYRESTGKHFVCKQNAWEQYQADKSSEDKNVLNEIWKSAKRIYPNDDHLIYLCSSILEQEPKHECKDYVTKITSEGE